jgi:hypothetical protein
MFSLVSVCSDACPVYSGSDKEQETTLHHSPPNLPTIEKEEVNKNREKQT